VTETPGAHPGEGGVPPEAAEIVAELKAKPAAKPKPKAKTKKGPSKLHLLIVESPAKVKTISKFIGGRFVVRACMGHVRDLPQHRLGVDVKNGFTPQYVTVRGKGDILKELKMLARKADLVYLATDPDREGESICWHLKEAMKLPDTKIRRVVFNEITKKVVKDAVETPLDGINTKLVESQQARRILDRLVGYSLSPLLWTKVRKGLSAGRVQSVAVRIICDREAEILAFVPQEYWTVEAKVAQGTPGAKPFSAKLAAVDGEKPKLGNGGEARAVVDRVSGEKFAVASVDKKDQRRFPPPPFITSTLQQEAAKRHHFTAKRTMMIAQTLYEGLDIGGGDREGLITYMRTDSVRVSVEAQQEARKALSDAFGPAILPAEPPVYKGRGRSQDAHEAIRPSLAGRDPDSLRKYLNPDQFKLYRLIWQRFLASQSAPALLEQTTVEISAGKCMFRATGTVVKALGWMAIYHEAPEEDAAEEEAEEDKEGFLPAGLAPGDALDLREITPLQHFTNPPPRYTDASLVKALEEDGIGRPSTYAPIISTILDRGYVERREGRFFPADLGKLVNELIVSHFPDIINVQFTAHMEEDLDRIEDGSLAWADALGEFHVPFAADMEKAKLEMRNVKKEMEVITDIPCERCGKPMMVRWGRHGKFLACSGYPDCKNAKSFSEGPDGKITVEEPEVTEEKCPKCGSFMVKRSGRFGRFLACQKYPECRTTKPIPMDFKCPKKGCGGNLVTRRSKRGRVFFGCDRYPECNFVSWDPPVKETCPQCGGLFMSERRLKSIRRLTCPVEGCGYVREDPLEAAAAPAVSATVPAGGAGELPASNSDTLSQNGRGGGEGTGE